MLVDDNSIPYEYFAGYHIIRGDSVPKTEISINKAKCFKSKEKAESALIKANNISGDFHFRAKELDGTLVSNAFSWNDTIQRMDKEGMFSKHINQEDKLQTTLKMLNSIMTNGLAVEDCTQVELMDYICEIKNDIQDVIDYIGNGD